MKRLSALLAVVVLLVLMLSPCAAAEMDFSDYYDLADGYYISKYDVKIDVNENNTLHVTENITADFQEERHGIYRFIPYNFDVQREDGSSSHARVKISNIKCSEEYEQTTDSGNCVLQIGSADFTVTGKHDYTISYDYKIGMDLLKDADELYYNIIGTGWDTFIGNLTFTVNMPKEFDKTKLGFSTGLFGASGTDIIKSNVEGNTIIGSATRPLYPNEGVTLRLELPEAYFSFNYAGQYALIALMGILPIICLVFVFAVWKKYGKDKKIVDVVEFRPPENMSCVDVAYWYKGRVDGNDVVPLLIELANEGYVSISEAGKHNYLITKTKKYSGNDSAKTIFMSGLFSHGSTVYKSELENKFYKYVDRIIYKYNTAENRIDVFENKSLFMRVICWIVTVIMLIISALIFNFTYTIPMKGLVFGIGIIVYLAAFVLSFFVRKRTDKGHEILQKINGFKMFLEEAEKERLEQLVEESPEYFYDILPYAYVLGVSKKWIDKFESIAIEPPHWYMGVDPYNRMRMIYFINSTVNDCKQTMLTKPQSASDGAGGFSGGSGFSGGGISGGGFGGGGGGSW